MLVCGAPSGVDTGAWPARGTVIGTGADSEPWAGAGAGTGAGGGDCSDPAAGSVAGSVVEGRGG